MLKKTITSLVLVGGLCGCVNAQFNYPRKNIQMRDTLYFPGNVRLSNIGGYAANGKEYALVGTQVGLTIVDVTNPDNIKKLYDIPGPNSIWREVKTWKGYAYVTTEAGDGLQIIDMRNLPGLPQVKQYTGDGEINNQLSSIHALHIDAGYVYLYGSKIGKQGAIICSLSDPWNPRYVGKYDERYVHDGYVRNDILYAAHISAGNFAVVDVKDKANPQVLATQETPLKFTHNTWLSDDSKTLFATDEKPDSYLASYDISNLSNITELDRIKSYNAKAGAIVHNTHILRDFAITSWYADGVTIVDIAKPDNMVEVGYFDSSPFSNSSFIGCWGVYPFLPSGNIVISDIDGGKSPQKGLMFVLTPNYKKASRLEGLVLDSISGNPIPGAKVEIVEMSKVDSSKINGVYKTGIVQDLGNSKYTLRYSKAGYITKEIKNVLLIEGQSVIQNVKLLRVLDGINSLENLKVIAEASPNPSNTAFNISLYGNVSEAKHYQILDITGKVVHEAAIEKSRFSIGDDLQAGIYLLIITNKDAKSKALKLVKF